VVTLSQVGVLISNQSQSKLAVSQESECLWKTKTLLMMKSQIYRVQCSFKNFEASLRIEFSDVFYVPRVPHFCVVHLSKPV
jgi:hypothetical protein